MIIATIHIIIILLIAYYWNFSQNDDSYSKHFYLGLFLRIIGGISLGLIYKFHYQGGDTISLFDDASFLKELALEKPMSFLDFLFFSDKVVHSIIYSGLEIQGPRAVFFTKIISVVNIFTNNNYWITGCYLSLFSFWGSWKCVTVFKKVFNKYKSASLIAFLYFPSLIFWSGGIIKESLLFGCICFLISKTLEITHLQSPNKVNNQNTGLFSNIISVFQHVILPLITLLLLWKLKYYYLAVLFPVLSVYIFISLMSKKYKLSFKYQFFTYLLVFLFLVLIATKFHPNLNISTIVKAIVTNNEIMVSQSLDKENLIHFYQLENSFISIIRNIPIALWEGFFRPYIWESGSWVKKIAALENLILSGLIFFVFIKMARSIFIIRKRKGIKGKYKLLVLSLFIYVISSEILLTLAAPNIGNLIRYKIGFMPFLLFWLLAQIDLPRLIKNN